MTTPAIPELDTQTWMERLADLDRPGMDNIVLYYEHRIGAFCRNPRLMLVPLDDHLVHRGDGVFEALRMTEGKILELDAHMERLQDSARALSLEPPCRWDEIRTLLLQLALASNLRDGGIKLLLGRGIGGLGVDPAECPQSSLYIVINRTRAIPESYWEKGLTACRSDIPAKQPYLARIKSTNYLPNALMAMEARNRGVDVSFSFDEHGFLAEAAVANVGIVDQEGTLLFPHFHHVLPGTTALLAMDLAREIMPVQQTDIAEQTIKDAAEVLIFGTTPECVAVVQYEGQNISNGKPGPIAKALRLKIHDALLAGGTSFIP